MLKWRWVFKGDEVVYNIDTIVDKVSIHLENNSYDTQSEAIEAIEVFIDDLEGKEKRAKGGIVDTPLESKGGKLMAQLSSITE